MSVLAGQNSIGKSLISGGILENKHRRTDMEALDDFAMDTVYGAALTTTATAETITTITATATCIISFLLVLQVSRALLLHLQT